MNTAEYLIKKLEELGITSFFGFPSEYNFNILKVLECNKNIDWIACTSALSAAYAADGYARVKGYGALITSYGVGELNAINAIAGSYAENVPVIHIVGVPLTKNISDKVRVHNNFQDVDPYNYLEIFKRVSETVAFLNRDNSKIEIDRVLRTFVKEKKPVYIAIPVDIAQKEISDKVVDYNWVSDKETLAIVVDKIVKKINASKKPLVLIDTLIKRFEAKSELKEFLEKTNLPVINFLMGADIIDFDYKNNLGTYFSKYKNSSALKYLESTDCLVTLGAVYTEKNTFDINFEHKVESQIAIYGTKTYIDGVCYENVKMSDIISAISEAVEYKEYDVEKQVLGYEQSTKYQEKMSLEYIYSRLQEFLKGEEILVIDTGSVLHGVSQMRIPYGTEIFVQTLWQSLGWATPATLGVSLANQDKRVVLLTGEGSHQTTALEIGNMLKLKLKPIIIVLNNKGYALEAAFSENKASFYNEAVSINYSKLARVFEEDVWSIKVETPEDFDRALKVTKILNKLCYIEVSIDPEEILEMTEEVAKDVKKMKKEQVSKTTELYNNINLEKEKLDIKTSFGTKVHESLK